MTPPARLSAAIQILDRILAGDSAETALTNWARGSRFAGSGDRLAIRDLVFEALRRKRSFAALGGALSGRGLMLGWIRNQGIDPQTMFTGDTYAPSKVTDADVCRAPDPLEALDCPDWLAPRLQASLGDDFPAVMRRLQSRAKVYLRVNSLKATPDQAIAALSRSGIGARAAPQNPFALDVFENARKINTSDAYLEGMVELQDLSSQELVRQIPLKEGQKVLDYCAGSGGKSLAMAARAKATFFAYDKFPHRLKDLSERARRAGAKISVIGDPGSAAPYDVVLCDSPCSGSGSWRRDPAGKWLLTEEKLHQILQVQSEILDLAAQLVLPKGVLVYATCSVLSEENEDQITSFLSRNPGWTCLTTLRLSVREEADGFFSATLGRTIS